MNAEHTKLNQCLATVNQRFQYRSDPKNFFTDVWFVMKDQQGVMCGDCDDYVITVLWLLCGGFWQFVWNVLILHRYRLHRVKTHTGEYHVVAQVGDAWFDNWTQLAMSKEMFFDYTGHQYVMWYLSPITIWFLIWGYVHNN